MLPSKWKQMFPFCGFIIIIKKIAVNKFVENILFLNEGVTKQGQSNFQ